MGKLKTAINNYTIPMVFLAVLAGVFIYWGSWVTLAALGVIIAISGGMIIIDAPAKTHIIYWAVVSLIGISGYAIKNHLGSTATIIFSGVLGLFVLAVIAQIASYFMKGKYKQ